MATNEPCLFFLEWEIEIRKQIRDVRDAYFQRRLRIIHDRKGDDAELVSQLRREEQKFEVKRELLDQERKTCHERWTLAFQEQVVVKS